MVARPTHMDVEHRYGARMWDYAVLMYTPANVDTHLGPWITPPGIEIPRKAVLQEACQQMGQGGWELVGVTHSSWTTELSNPTYYTLFFKRPLQR
jgi:hypothetical protein